MPAKLHRLGRRGCGFESRRFQSSLHVWRERKLPQTLGPSSKGRGRKRFVTFCRRIIENDRPGECRTDYMVRACRKARRGSTPAPRSAGPSGACPALCLRGLPCEALAEPEAGNVCPTIRRLVGLRFASGTNAGGTTFNPKVAGASPASERSSSTDRASEMFLQAVVVRGGPFGMLCIALRKWGLSHDHN